MPSDQLLSGPPDGHAREGLDLGLALLGATDVPAEPRQVKNVRHWLRGLLGEEHPVLFEAELLGSELVTNAIVHSDSARLKGHGRPGTVSIVVRALGQAVRVEVTDAGSARCSPRLLDAGTDAIDGRGLRLLQEITGGRCGTWSHEKGRTVWFHLEHRAPDRKSAGR